MVETFRCALRSRTLGEPCYGTASQVRRWILVEQPGGWGASAVTQSRLAADVAAGLQSVARTVGARLLLIRRHGRTDPDERTCYAVVSTPSARRIERLCFTEPAELLAHDWSPLRRFEPVGGDPVLTPLYLVCTNGSHDVCCAQFGRPVARVLSTAFGDRVWEVSHIGGDRFAGNLVCLPDGVYYGRVAPGNAVKLVEEFEAGRLILSHYRGRSSFPFVVQAAEQFAREARSLTGIDDIVAHDSRRIGESRFQVALRTRDANTITAVVECSEAIDPQQLTCNSNSEEHPPRYRLVSLAT